MATMINKQRKREYDTLRIGAVTMYPKCKSICKLMHRLVHNIALCKRNANRIMHHGMHAAHHAHAQICMFVVASVLRRYVNTKIRIVFHPIGLHGVSTNR